MSKWNFEQAIAPWLAKQKEEAMQATWGHLAPQKNKEYHGRMVFAVGCFGNDEHNPTPILCEFGDLESSPWFFEFLQEFLQELEVEVGCVYQFRGVFKNYAFKGEISLLLDPSAADEDVCENNCAINLNFQQFSNSAISLKRLG